MPPSYNPGYVFQAICGQPYPSVSDLKAWTVLGKGTTIVSNAAVGLFGYDVSCFNSMCAGSTNTYDFCSSFTGLKIDGWSIGIYSSTTTSDSGSFLIVQHQESAGDILIKPDYRSSNYGGCPVYQFTGQYSVIAGTGPPT